MGFTGSLEKMKIFAYKKSNFTESAGQYTVYINPEKYSRTYTICYNDVRAQGSPGGSPKFNKIPSEEIKFELIFDGTGVVPSPIPGVVPFTADGITKQISDFTEKVFKYQGGIHSPNYLILRWATLTFWCRLLSLTINYTMFKPDGTPLRARADATFVEFKNEQQLALEASDSSPDLSHVVTVLTGDTLPLMCYRIYGTSVYYPQVARVNGLTDFRNLTVGQQLLFPPLQGAPE